MIARDRIACLLATWVIPWTASVAGAQPAPIPHYRLPYLAASGECSAPAGEVAPVAVAVHTVAQPDAAWLQLHFDASTNLGTNSYLTITSMRDGAQQRFNSQTLRDWSYHSAFFNGEVLEVTLHVAPGEQGVSFQIRELTVGMYVSAVPSEPVPESLCFSQADDQDDRTASTDPRTGRIVPVGCTGWIVSNGAYLTAGHCTGFGMQTLEFNVPASLSDGTIQHPGPEDQYPITAVTDTQQLSEGQDYAVFQCGPNANTGLLPVQAQNAFYRMSRDDSPATVRVTGYGVDDTPEGTTGGRNAQNQTEQTHAGPFVAEVNQAADDVYLTYQVDTTGGNSGSPVMIDGTITALAIHTNGRCDNPAYYYNLGTGFENDDLEAGIATFPGPVVRYVDKGHPHAASLGNGTVFRPYTTVGAGVTSVPAGGIVSIVTGSYNETMTITKALTLSAPVGTVVIGQ
jgi:V8-like Glu-specific endopeptidase